MKLLDFEEWKNHRKFLPMIEAGIDPDEGWMWIEKVEGTTTYKRYCDHDEHGGKEYLYVGPRGSGVTHTGAFE